MKNRAEILELMELYKSGKPLSDFEEQMRRSSETSKILNGIAQNNTWSENDKKRAMIASRFLHSIAKGENALELAYALEENRKKTPPEIFVVPQYIHEAIAWICQ